MVKFCNTCHTCQIIGKPNQNKQVAPLIPIPVMEEPFSRVIIDCVGPLPKTKAENQYLLTIMCSSTRFPEAIPMKNIKAPKIVAALIRFFTLVGLPKAIQSDQGSNFMSGPSNNSCMSWELSSILQVHTIPNPKGLWRSSTRL